MLSLPAELARSALDAAPDAMLLVDSTGVIRFANRQAVELFGYPHAKLIGSPIELLLPEHFRTWHVEHRQRYLKNARTRPMGMGLELSALTSGGRTIPVEISLSPLGEGDDVLTAAAIRDATERKSVEAAMMRARKEAELAREAAVRANQAKSRFLATASHDLRQPLQALSLLNGTLRRLPTEVAASEALAQQEQTIIIMSRLVNALLDISKLESGAIEPEITDFTVASIFEELRREFATLAADKGLELNVECCEDTVRSDAALLEQILRNLVSNAIKYTPHGTVQVRCLHEAALVHLEVLDTGIGIPADQMPYIFEEFYQVGVGPNTTREGYGLGLSWPATIKTFG